MAFPRFRRYDVPRAGANAMNRLVIEKPLREKLCASNGFEVELCDEGGQPFGYFISFPSSHGKWPPGMTWEEVDKMFPPEEIEAARNDPRPRIPMDEALRRFGIQ